MWDLQQENETEENLVCIFKIYIRLDFIILFLFRLIIISGFESTCIYLSARWHASINKIR